MVDGNTADYSKDFDPGTLKGAQGTIPGAEANDAFKKRLDGTNGSPLSSYAYGPEAYDATMLIALAAVKAGAVDGPSIQAQMAAVSGSTNGTKCTGFKECADLLASGKEIDYQPVSGVGPFNSAKTRRARTSVCSSTTRTT